MAARVDNIQSRWLAPLHTPWRQRGAGGLRWRGGTGLGAGNPTFGASGLGSQSLGLAISGACSQRIFGSGSRAIEQAGGE